MAAEFVLELRDVSSLTEARFAAGELFTHIRLAPALAQGPEATVLEIKAFLSGVSVGVELTGTEEQPAWADYSVRANILTDSEGHYSLVPPGSEGHMAHSIVVIEDVHKALPQGFGRPAGLSLPGAEEYKTGFADFDAHQDFLETVRTAYGI